MNSQPAVVVELAGTHAWVETGAAGAECASCLGGAGCAPATGTPRRYLARNDIAARAGERVEVVAPPGMVWRAAMASYVLPLGMGCALAALGQQMAGDGAAVAGMMAGLVAGAVLMRAAGRRMDGGGRLLQLRRPTNVISVIKEIS